MKKSLLIAGLLMPLGLQAAPQVYLSVSGGQAYLSTGDDQTVFFSPEYWKTLVANHHNRFPWYWGVSAGGQAQISSQWEGSLGIGYYQASSITENGQVFQYSSSQFHNFNYEYQIRPARYLIETKLSSRFRTVYHPYITAGLGISRNESRDYVETALDNNAVIDAPFQDFTTTGFAYTVGLGLDIDVDPNLRVGFGYQYGDWGTAQLGTSPAQVTGDTVNSGHLTASQLLLQATYVINI